MENFILGVQLSAIELIVSLLSIQVANASQFHLNALQPNLLSVPQEIALIEPKPISAPKTALLKRVSFYANQYGVSAYQMERTIYCESRFRNIQSEVINKKGEREQSFGIVQIHLPSNPAITKAQALDPEFSLNFMAKEFKSGNDWKWFGYNPATDRCK